MSNPHEHEARQFYWAADTEYCPHEPEPERYTDAWDQWMCNHQMSDDGPICLEAPAGTACPACSAEHGDMVPWDDCTERAHVRPKRGVVPNPDSSHQPIPVWVAGIECLDRECEEYFNEDGDDDPTVEVCSHIRQETACSCQRLDDGEYALGTCPSLVTA